jgi:hypothetical protein
VIAITRTLLQFSEPSSHFLRTRRNRFVGSDTAEDRNSTLYQLLILH